MHDDVFWQPGITLDQVEKQVIKKAYRFFENNKTRTAAALDIAIRTLDAKLARYEKEDSAKDDNPKAN